MVVATDLTNDGQSGEGEHETCESGDDVRRLRTEAGLTQVQLAVAAGLDPQSISRIERGEINPLPETRDRILAALRTTRRAS